MFVLIPDLNWVPVEMGSLSYYHSATGDHTLYCYDMSANNIAGFCIVVARRMMWGCQLFALNKILHVWPFYWRLFGGIGFLLLILLPCVWRRLTVKHEKNLGLWNFPRHAYIGRKLLARKFRIRWEKEKKKQLGCVRAGLVFVFFCTGIYTFPTESFGYGPKLFIPTRI